MKYMEIDEICVIIRDELKIILDIEENKLDTIIENVKIRLEKDLTTPEDKKL